MLHRPIRNPRARLSGRGRRSPGRDCPAGLGLLLDLPLLLFGGTALVVLLLAASLVVVALACMTAPFWLAGRTVLALGRRRGSPASGSVSSRTSAALMHQLDEIRRLPEARVEEAGRLPHPR